MAVQQQTLALVKSGFLPESIRTHEQAIAIAIKGHEIGMPMMQAFAQISIIKGKPCLGGEGMLAMIYKNCPGAVINFIRNDNEACLIEAKRPGPDHKLTQFGFNIEDAKRAGLLGKDNWKQYPRAMNRNRAISEMARSIFPDAIAGISYTPEEMGAVVNEDGEVVQQVIPATKNVTPINTVNSAPPSTEKAVNVTVVCDPDLVYDDANMDHRRYLKSICAKFDVDNKAAMAEISVSAHKENIRVTSLDAYCKSYLKSCGFDVDNETIDAQIEQQLEEKL